MRKKTDRHQNRFCVPYHGSKWLELNALYQGDIPERMAGKLQYIRTFGNVALDCTGPCGCRDLYSGRHGLGSNSGRRGEQSTQIGKDQQRPTPTIQGLSPYEQDAFCFPESSRKTK